MKEISIEKNGVKTTACIISCFVLLGKTYCIYSIKNKNKNYDIYCEEIINNKTVPIAKEDENLVKNVSKRILVR